MRSDDLITAGIVEDELEALDMFPIECLEDFCGGPDEDNDLGGLEDCE